MSRYSAVEQVVTEVLADAVDSADALQRTLETLGNGCAWRAIFVWVVSDDHRELDCTTSWVADMPGIEALAVARERKCLMIGQEAPGLTWQSADVLWAADVVDAATLRWQGKAPVEDLHGWMCAPILSGERVLGVLECFSAEVIEPDQALLDLNAGAAAQLGVFLDQHQEQGSDRRARDSDRILEQVDAVLLHAILDHTDAVMFARDGDGRYLFVNRGYEELFGVRNEDLRGKTDHALFPAEVADMFRANDLQVVKGGQPVRVEEVVPTPSGTRTYLSTKFPMKDSSGIPGGICGMAVDITDRKQLEENREALLRQEREQVMRLQQAVSHLAGGIAHEINTPIQFISDNLQFISQALVTLEKWSTGTHTDQSSPRPIEPSDIDFITQELPLAVSQALEGAQRVARIVDAMKSFGHKDGADQGPVDINRSLESTIVVASHEWRDVADIETHFGDIKHVSGFGNSLGQVFLNLLVNACHAVTEKSAVSGGRGKIAIRTWADNDEVCVSIADTGNGIPADIREKIFDPFFTTKDVGKGTGQGLSLSRSIVDRHNGRLLFDGNDDGGTTFTIRLPSAGV